MAFTISYPTIPPKYAANGPKLACLVLKNDLKNSVLFSFEDNFLADYIKGSSSE
jgi:hypothetical protein